VLLNVINIIFECMYIDLQNWSSLLEQGCLDQLGGNTECDDDHILSSDGTMATDFSNVSQKAEENKLSKKQLRCIFFIRTAYC